MAGGAAGIAARPRPPDPLWLRPMSERIRLTVASAVTALLLAAVSIAGIAVHTGSPAPATSAAVSLTTQATQVTPTPNRHAEQD
jgi:hypothetical protein